MADHTITFTGLNLVAEDVDATLAFYRLLGLSIPDDAVWRTATGAHHVTGGPAGSGAGIELDSPALAAAYHAGYAAAPSPGGAILGFGVASRDAVDDLHGRLVAAGHPSRQEPYDAFWGARYAIVADPDGRDVGIMSSPDADHRHPGPDL
jgi:catechol 2,3-dioxygenase-like lactoylglutathione lyase family enzyme